MRKASAHMQQSNPFSHAILQQNVHPVSLQFLTRESLHTQRHLWWAYTIPAWGVLRHIPETCMVVLRIFLWQPKLILHLLPKGIEKSLWSCGLGSLGPHSHCLWGGPIPSSSSPRCLGNWTRRITIYPRLLTALLHASPSRNLCRRC